MKKITLTAMVLAVACMFAACTKEGVYNPKEKISKIFESSVSTYTMGSTTTTDETPKHPTESWTWDGKLLSSITYYEGDGTVDETVTFTYDGKQLSKMQTVGSNSYTQFIYDGSKLEKFETYYSNRLESAGTVTYDGKKVVQIDVVDYDNNKSNEKTFFTVGSGYHCSRSCRNHRHAEALQPSECSGGVDSCVEEHPRGLYQHGRGAVENP